MIHKVKHCHVLTGEITPPGDKSISHRAIILNSIARGKARISNLSPGADCLSTINCLKSLGVEMKVHQSSGAASDLIITGVDKHGLKEAQDVLNAGNSGTTMRLLAGLLAARSFTTIITGDASLRSRPMGRVIEPLRLMGADIQGRDNNSFAPLVICGKELHGISYSLPVASAQVKSAILLAGLLADSNTIIQEPAPSRDHTERLLTRMGARLEKEDTRIILSPDSIPLTALDLCIPGDVSAAAYWLVAGAIHPNARITLPDCGINPRRTGIIDSLQAMGARLHIANQRIEGGEPVADLYIESSNLNGIEIGSEMAVRLIDEIPVLAVAACAARGTTIIRGAAELRVKESDRIETTVRELSLLGAVIQELPDGMIIHGGRKLQGAVVHSHLDHRLAMSLAVAALLAEGETIIQDAEVVEISYPNFWQDIQDLTLDTKTQNTADISRQV